MQRDYAADFVREMGCTEQDWLRWLPAALGVHSWRITGAHCAVQIHQGSLMLSWTTLEPLRMGWVHMPRLQVQFVFSELDEQQRLQFMRRFDLYMQRGGG